jgi:hypothetical protein
MPDQIGGMGQTSAMMSRDAMKEYGLAGGVSQQVGGQRHLLGGCS